MASRVDEKSARPSVFYVRRADELRAAIDEELSRLPRYTMGLVLIGLLACVSLYLSIVAKELPIWVPLLVASAGVALVQWRHMCQRRLIQLSSLAEYYEKGIARLEREWKLLDRGEGFIDQDHFYLA